MSEPRNDEPNLDLIRMVQNARMQHDAEAMPSRLTGIYWIEAKRQGAGAPPTPRAGHWIIPTTVSRVDALWAAIKEATEAGRLGYKSKVSTASRSGSVDERVILVVTYDADDRDDVARVREALRTLGINDPIEYHRVSD